MVRRWLLLVTVVLLGVMSIPGTPAWAHNQLVSSDPEDGDSMAQGPDAIELAFLATLDESNAELSVAGPDGASVVAGEPEFDGSTVTVPVDTGQAGDYEVAYEMLSSDGHWADGTLVFTVTEGEQPEPTPEPAAESTAAATPAGPAGVSPEPAAQREADEDGSGLAWWVWLVLAAGIAAAAAGAFFLARRGRTART